MGDVEGEGYVGGEGEGEGEALTLILTLTRTLQKTDNWNVDIAQELEEYLAELNTISVNFVKAGGGIW